MVAPTPALHAASTVLTAAETTTWYNTMQFLLAPPMCRLVTTAGTTTSGTPLTWVSVSFDSESYDSTGMHDNVTNNSRITIATSGYYRIAGKIRGGTSATSLAARVAVSGASVLTSEMWTLWATGAYAEPTVNTTLYLTAGQYIEMQAAATTASVSLNAASCYLEAHWVSV